MAKVLVADDEGVVRLVLARQLRRAGHEVAVAGDGQAAAGLLEHETFDVIISDMNMPGLDGIGLLSRAAQIAPDTEFIILTGHGNVENAIEAFKAGNVFDYLLKPLNDIFELNEVVARAIERRTLRIRERPSGRRASGPRGAVGRGEAQAVDTRRARRTDGPAQSPDHPRPPQFRLWRTTLLLECPSFFLTWTASRS